MEMKAKARRLKMEQNLDILFVDYIQLMRPGGKFENRNSGDVLYFSLPQGIGEGD